MAEMNEVRVRRYRKKPGIVEAVQWFPGKDVPGVFMHEPPEPVARGRYHESHPDRHKEPAYPAVRTIQGRVVRILPGEWVITESDGIHHYPCAPDEFDRLYDPADDQPVSDRSRHLLEAMNSAAGLCQSEANKWQHGDHKTFEHWQIIATVLQGEHLATTIEINCLSDEVERLKQALLNAGHALCARSINSAGWWNDELVARQVRAIEKLTGYMFR